MCIQKFQNQPGMTAEAAMHLLADYRLTIPWICQLLIDNGPHKQGAVDPQDTSQNYKI